MATELFRMVPADAKRLSGFVDLRSTRWAVITGFRILFMDEGTGNLDVKREVGALLARLRFTRVVIAHRPETIAMADRVVAIEGGRIVRGAARQTLHAVA